MVPWGLRGDPSNISAVWYMFNFFFSHRVSLMRNELKNNAQCIKEIKRNALRKECVDM